MSLKPEKYSRSLNPPQGGIVLLDSGVGSLSISSAINQELPFVSTVSIGDQLYFPYGTKDDMFIQQRMSELLDFALAEFSPEVVVIACNTASTFILPYLRSNYNLPIVGVVPPIKPAAENSITKNIAILVTKATSRRAYLEELISSFAANCQVQIVPCSQLPSLAERKINGEALSLADFSDDLSVLLESSDIDSLVLGCTHFSVLTEELCSFLGSNIKIYDPSRAVAKQVSRVLGKCNSLAARESWFLSTGKCDYSNKKRYQRLGIEQLYCI